MSFSRPAFAVEQEAIKGLDAVCAESFCRPPLQIKLQKKDGSYFEQNTGIPLPVVHADTVTLYPGETVYVEAEMGKDSLENLRGVERISDPSKTLVLTFQQELSGKKKNRPVMVLKVMNPFKQSIKYHAKVMLISGNVIKTSTRPVEAGQTTYESWPDPILQVILTDFRFSAAKDKKCEF